MTNSQTPSCEITCLLKEIANNFIAVASKSQFQSKKRIQEYAFLLSQFENQKFIYFFDFKLKKKVIRNDSLMLLNELDTKELESKRNFVAQIHQLLV
jgi:hypothetical protein